MKHDLAKEISDWVERDLISEDQATSICELYDVDFHESKNRSWGYRILVLLGYLFIGLSVITLLGANWEEIPRSVRMVGLIALTMGTHSLGLRYFFRGGEEGTGSAVGLFFLGNLFFGASIVLICQIYHLGATIPDEIFWWALGTLPFAVILKNNWLALLSAALGLVWFFLEADAHAFPAWYIIFAAASFYVLIAGNKTSSLLFVTTVGGFLLWIESALSYLLTGFDDIAPEQFFITVGIFVLLYASSLLLGKSTHTRAKDYGALLSVWVLRFALITMLVLSFEDPWKELIQSSWEHTMAMTLIFTVVVAAAIAVAYYAKDLLLVGIIAAFSVVVMVTVVGIGNPFHAVLLQVVTNIALVVAGIGLIVRGIDAGISHYFFIGVATILLTALMRYIDLIGDYIGGAILFAIFAAVLLGSARLWKRKLNPKVAR